MIAAVIVAAGQGVRMGGGARKQYRLLAGRPVLAHSLAAFQAAPAVGHLVVVVPEEEIDYCRRAIIEPARPTKPVSLVRGGLRRQDSVANGLAGVEAPEGIVLIHDGVRPLVDADLIARCIAGAKQWQACIPVLAVSDTLKQVDPQGVVRGTPTRDTFHLAQTPQAFDLALIREAHAAARRNGWEATDDASLVERLGRPVHVIPGARHNLKITTPEDLLIAEALLAPPSALPRPASK